MGCEQSIVSEPLDKSDLVPNLGSNLEVYTASASLGYCFVQFLAEWPDYYVIIDLRKKKAFEKSHIAGAISIHDIIDEFSYFTQDMIVLFYSYNPSSPEIKLYLEQLETQEIIPSFIYVLNVPYSTYRRRYGFTLSNFERTQGQYPGPVEIIPASKKTSAIYTVTRQQFANCRILVAYLMCHEVINISGVKLFVKTPGITLKNFELNDKQQPIQEACDYAANILGDKQNKKKNILIVEETGSQYSSIICAYVLIKKLGCDIGAVLETLVSRYLELDAYYIEYIEQM